MKRLALIVLTLALGFTNAQAQLNVKSSLTSPTVITTTVRSAAGLAYQDKYGYFLFFKSTNSYDKVAMFRLGDGYDDSMLTLTQLHDLCTDIGDQILTVETWPGESCDIQATIEKGMIRLTFKQNAGICQLWYKDVDKFIEELKKFVDSQQK